jgi:hypothetical protein
MEGGFRKRQKTGCKMLRSIAEFGVAKPLRPVHTPIKHRVYINSFMNKRVKTPNVNPWPPCPTQKSRVNPSKIRKLMLRTIAVMPQGFHLLKWAVCLASANRSLKKRGINLSRKSVYV